MQRLAAGLRWGLFYATVSSAVALGSVLAHGSTVLRPYHVNALQVVALYFASGILGGLIFGALTPLGRTLTGAVILGCLTAAPVGALMTAAVAPDATMGSSEWAWIVVALTFFGAVCGAGIWVVNNRRAS